MSHFPIDDALRYAAAQRLPFMVGFHELLSIPSVSTDPAYRGDLLRCAAWVVAEMERLGLARCQQIPTEGHPVLYGEWLEAGPERPTVLIYAHYDVQPVDPLVLWHSPPFEPTVREGKLYARGTVDDKCGVWIVLKAIESLLQGAGRLPVNLKLLFEGEEEMGSPHLRDCVRAHRQLFQADALIECDGPFRPAQPELFYALRGAVAAEVLVRGPDHDLHSGSFGGAVHNPIHLVGTIVGALHDRAGRVAIPGFYDRVRPLAAAEREALQQAWTLAGPQWEASAGTARFWAESLGPLPERIAALPTLDVFGIWGGYQGVGVKSIIPAAAGFKAMMRLVADQDPAEVGQQFVDFVNSFACETLELEVHLLAQAWPAAVPMESPAIEAAQRAYAAGLGKRAVLRRGGGTLPIRGLIQHEFGIPIVPFGFGSGDNAHAPNEYMHAADLQLGIELAIHLFAELAQLDHGL